MSLSKGGRTAHTSGSGTSGNGGSGSGGSGIGERVVLMSPSLSIKPVPPTAIAATTTSLATVPPAEIAGTAVEATAVDGVGDSGGDGVDDIPEPGYPSYHTNGNGTGTGTGAGSGNGIGSCIGNNGDTDAVGHINDSGTDTGTSAGTSGSGKTSGAERLRSSRSGYSFIPPGRE